MDHKRGRAAYQRAFNHGEISNTDVLSGTSIFTYAEELALPQIEELGDQIKTHIDDVRLETESMSMMSIRSELSPTLKVTDIDRTSREKIRFLADEIDDKVESLQPTIAVLTLDRTVPFLMISVLFVVFLLIPWLLYLSFIISKRKAILFERRRALEHLGLLDEFMKEPPPLKCFFQ